MSAQWLAQQQDTWDNLTPDQQACHRGNTDPFSGPVDPQAWQQAINRDTAAARRERPSLCGCWRQDCAECGSRMAAGERPGKGARRRYTMAGGV